MNVSMGIIYGEGEIAFMRLQEELLRMRSSDDSILAFGAIESISSSDSSDSREERPPIATHLLAESPDAFDGCGNVSLAGWRPGGNRHQPTVKEVLFHKCAMAQRT